MPGKKKNCARGSNKKRSIEQKKKIRAKEKKIRAKSRLEYLKAVKKTKAAKNAAQYLSKAFPPHSVIPQKIVENAAQKYNTSVALLVLALARKKRRVERKKT